MLEIRPLQDNTEKVEACVECGIFFDPELMYYGAFTDGTVTGICAFTVKNECAVILSLRNSGMSNYNILSTLCMAVLNFTDLCGIHTAIFSDSDTELAKCIGFNYKNGIYSFDTDLIFSDKRDKNE